jgi:hypothetical protein
MKNNYSTILLAAVLILASAAMRIITAEFHLPNFTPIAAVGLFSGAVITDKKYAYILPLMAMFIADIYFTLFTSINGFYGIEQVLVYIGMALVTLLGTNMNKITGMKVLGYSLIGSFIFFAVSNFGSYLKGWNGYDFNGFVQTYILAIPFYKNSLVADLAGSVALFGLYFAGKKALVPQTQNA